MKHFLMLTASFVLLFSTIGCNGTGKESATKLDMQKVESVKLKSDWDSISYAFGYNTAERLIRDSVPVNPTIYLRAMIDAFLAREEVTLLDQKGIETAFRSFDEKRRQRYEQEMKLKHKQDSIKAIGLKAEGEKLLADNKKNSKITTTPSGLQYEIIEPGKGERPKSGQACRLHFRATLTNGDLWTDTHVPKPMPGMPAEEMEKERPPIVVGVDKIPPGWSEAVKLMPEGSKYKFYIPSELMYGERGLKNQQETVIPPHAVIIMEIEMFGPVPIEETIDPRQGQPRPGVPNPNGPMPPQGEMR